MATHEIKQDQRGPELFATLTANGIAQNLTGATVKFSMESTRTGTIKVNAGTVTIVDAATGQVKYSWQATDTDTPGLYRAEFEVTGLSVTPVRFPSDEFLYVLVLPKVA